MSEIMRLHTMNRHYNSPKYVEVEVTGDRQELLTQLGLDPTDEGLVLVERIIDHKIGVMDTKNNIFHAYTNKDNNVVYGSATYNDVVMAFEDEEFKRICVANFGGLHGITKSNYGKTGVAGIEGEVTYEQVLAVTNIGTLFASNKSIVRFNEFVYFKNLNLIANNAFSSCSLMQEITLPNIVLAASSVFKSCSSLREVNTPFGLRLLTADNMFYYCSSLSSLDVSGWDMSACRNCQSMFNCCSSLSSLDVSGWDVSACLNMSNMFSECSSLSSLDVSGWDVSACRNCQGMFLYCRALSSLDVSGWDMSACKNCQGMFYNCRALSSLDVSGWDVSACLNMLGMFQNCSSLSSLDVSGWDVSACTDT